MIRILWIEDEVNKGNIEEKVWLEMQGKYKLDIRENATIAVEALTEHVYNGIIIDIRLPPGNDDRWVKKYYREGSDRTYERLGVDLLAYVLDPQNNGVLAANKDLDKIGIFTAEIWNSLKVELKKHSHLKAFIKKKNYLHKTYNEEGDFENFIKKIIK